MFGTQGNWKKWKSWPKFEVNGLDWQCCLAGSSKTAPRIFIFSIDLGAECLSYLKSIETHARAFLTLIILSISTVFSTYILFSTRGRWQKGKDKSSLQIGVLSNLHTDFPICSIVPFFPSPILQFPLLGTIFSLPFCCLLFMLIEHQKLICKLVIHSACAFLHHNGRSSNLNSSWVGEGAIHPCPFKA